MLFANFFDDFLGQACVMFIFFVLGIGWICSTLAKSKTVHTAAKVGFWSWFLSDD